MVQKCQTVWPESVKLKVFKVTVQKYFELKVYIFLIASKAWVRWPEQFGSNSNCTLTNGENGEIRTKSTKGSIWGISGVFEVDADSKNILDPPRSFSRHWKVIKDYFIRI